MTFFLNVFPEFTKFSDKNICHCSNLLPLVLETRMLSQHQQDTCERQDLKIQPNSCFSDLSDSVNLLNSLNSMKVLLHLEKKLQCVSSARFSEIDLLKLFNLVKTITFPAYVCTHKFGFRFHKTFTHSLLLSSYRYHGKLICLINLIPFI